MNYATFAALTNYDTPAAALAANPNDGDAWLLNETKIFQDGTMGNPRAANTDENTYKKGSQRQKARTLTPTVDRNKISAAVYSNNGNKRDGYANTTPGGGTWVNRENVANTKGPAIRHKVSWYVTDSNQSAGYRRVFGVLEDPTTTSPYRDDDNQVRI
jgi:hypothetical protein